MNHYNNSCDSCRIELKNIFSYSGRYLFSSNHDFFTAFLTTKGQKNNGDRFQFCDECEKEFKNYLVEEAIKELNQKNIANSEILTYRFFQSNFTEENWQKYQTALTENIKRHSQEWKISQVNYQPYEREKPREDSRSSRLWKGKLTKETILFHQSSQLEYDQNSSLTLENSWEPRKEYFKSDFLPEKWAEIEKKVNSEKKPENQPENKTADLIILGAITLIITTIILLIYLMRRKKNKK